MGVHVRQVTLLQVETQGPRLLPAFASAMPWGLRVPCSSLVEGKKYQFWLQSDVQHFCSNFIPELVTWPCLDAGEAGKAPGRAAISNAVDGKVFILFCCVLTGSHLSHRHDASLSRLRPLSSPPYSGFQQSVQCCPCLHG